MPRVYENAIEYQYPPTHTLSWLLRKYPNPFATHVFSVDTLERTIDPTTGVLRSERVIGVQQGAPKWITKLFQLPETAYVREVIFIYPEGKDGPRAECMSMNLNLAQYVECLEYITYTPHGKDQPAPTASTPAPASTDAASTPWASGSPRTESPSTLFKQHALLVSHFPTRMVASRIEKASLDRFQSNAGIGRQGFEWVLERGLEAVAAWRKRMEGSGPAAAPAAASQ